MARTFETLTFDGIGPDETLIPDGYGHLNWDNIGVTQPNPLADNGYAHDLRSGDSVAYNADGNPGTISSGHAFALENGWFAAGNEKHVAVTFTGYFRKTEIASLTVQVNENSHKIKFPSDFNHVTKVVITTENPDDPTRTQVAIEDLTVKARGAHAHSTVADLQHHDTGHVMDPLSDLQHHGGDFLV